MYHEKANQAPPSFVLSALNVINDSELQYKSATNKRLHVEMCLIRLCFLLQSVSGSQLAVSSSQPAADDVKKNSSSVENGPVSSFQLAVSSSQVAEEAQRAVPEKEYAVNNIVDNIVAEAAPVHVPKPLATPIPPPTVVTDAPTMPAAATNSRKPPAGAKRLSMDMLQDLDTEVAKAAASQGQEKKVLTAEVANQLFEAYKAKLPAANKTVLHSQFCMMRVEVHPPDEVRLISPSAFTDGYAKDQKTPLIDYYRAETGMVVRITTEIQEDESVMAAQSITVLSKSEMFEAMATKNPNLAALKDGLGMTIEY